MLQTVGPGSLKYPRDHRIEISLRPDGCCANASSSYFILTLTIRDVKLGAERSCFIHLAGDGCASRRAQLSCALLLDLWLVPFSHPTVANAREIQHFQLAEK